MAPRVRHTSASEDTSRTGENTQSSANVLLSTGTLGSRTLEETREAEDFMETLRRDIEACKAKNDLLAAAAAEY